MKPDWINQNMKKGSGSSSSDSMSKVYGSGSSGLMHSKIAKPSMSMGGLVHCQSSTKPVQMLADGDTEETYKQRGAEASSGEKVGFFERLRMGNIDDPKSEAYNRLGAGRGRSMAAAAKASEEPAAEPAKAEAPATQKSVEPAKAASPGMGSDTEFGDLDGAIEAAAKRKAAEKAETPARARATPAAPAKRRASAPASSPAPSAIPLSQMKGAEYASLSNIADKAEADPGTSLAAKQAARRNANAALKTYEDAADAEKTGRSVAFKR